MRRRRFGGALFSENLLLFPLSENKGEGGDALFELREPHARIGGGELLVCPAHAGGIHRLEKVDEEDDEHDDGEGRKDDREDEGKVVPAL